MDLMKKLSFVQLNRSSEIFGNISVAWFSGGIVGTIFSHSFELIEFVIFFVITLSMSVTFFIISLEIIKRQKND